MRKPVISSVFTDFLHEGHKGSWVCMRNPQGWRKLCRLWGTNSLLGPPASCQHKTSLVRSKGHGKHPSSGHRSYLMSLQPKHQNKKHRRRPQQQRTPQLGPSSRPLLGRACFGSLGLGISEAEPPGSEPGEEAATPVVGPKGDMQKKDRDLAAGVQGSGEEQVQLAPSLSRPA